MLAHSIQLVEATDEHIALMVPFARKADKDEVYAATGGCLWDALEEGVRQGALAGVYDGRVVGIYGLTMIGDGVGCPWMLGTDMIEANPIRVARVSREVVEGWKREAKYMFNYVDARHTSAIRWLKWLGFKIHEPEPYGHLGLPFHKFDMEVGDV